MTLLVTRGQVQKRCNGHSCYSTSECVFRKNQCFCSCGVVIAKGQVPVHAGSLIMAGLGLMMGSLDQIGSGLKSI